MEITFESLCGNHIFSGCELTSENIDCVYGIEKCQVCLFVLDGITYKAVEDPDDNYRSFCRPLEITEQKPKYMFPGIPVVSSMMENTKYEHNDVLVIRDAANGNSIVEVGTINDDDWYPCCYFQYRPEDMACNQEVEK